MQSQSHIGVDHRMDDVQDVELSSPVNKANQDEKASAFWTKPRIVLAIAALCTLLAVVLFGAVFATVYAVPTLQLDNKVHEVLQNAALPDVSSLAVPTTTAAAFATTSNMDILQSTTTCTPTTGTNSVTNLDYYIVASSVQGDTAVRGGQISALVVCKSSAADIWAYITDTAGNKVFTFDTKTCAWNAKAQRYQFAYVWTIPTDSTLAINYIYQFTVQAGYTASNANDYNYAKAKAYNCNIGTFSVLASPGSCTSDAQCGSSQQCTSSGICTIPQHLPSWTSGCQWSGVSPSGCNSAGQIHTVNQCKTRDINVNPSYCTQPPTASTTAAQSCAKPTCANGQTCQTGTTITNTYSGVQYKAEGWCGAITGSTNVCTPGDFCSDGTFCIGSFYCRARCSSNSECQADEVCQNKRCITTKCLNNAQCPSGSICTNNQCVVKPTCTTDSQCEAEKYCSNGTCEWRTCTTSANCPTGQVCDNGFCEVGNCLTDSNCATTHECKSNQCTLRTSCSSNSQCLSTHRCNTIENKCVVRDCTIDSQCEAEKFCSSNGTCDWRTCTTTANCPAGQVCDSGFCEVGNCVADSNCAATHQCLSNQCTLRTTCSSNSQCSAGQVCASGTCKAGTCTADSQCLATQQCTNNQCVARTSCTSNTQCASTHTCSNGQCVERECMSDAQCPGAKWCSSTGTCMYTVCTSSSSCPTGQICTGSVCDFPECTTNSDCLSTQQCTNNQCVAKPSGSCTSNSQCAAGQVCASGSCKVGNCVTDSNCSSTQQCTNNQCVAKPTTNTYSWTLQDGTCREGLITTGCNAPKFQTQTWKCVDQYGYDAADYDCTSQGDAKPAAPSPIECNEKVGGCGYNEYCWTGYTDYQTHNGVVIVDVRGKCQTSDNSGSNAAVTPHHNTLALFVTLMLAVVACVFAA